MKKKVGDDITGGCIWETIRKIKISSSAAFIDYSAIDISNDGRVVITSQENSALWLGQVTGITNGVIDPDAFEWVVLDRVDVCQIVLLFIYIRI